MFCGVCAKPTTAPTTTTVSLRSTLECVLVLFGCSCHWLSLSLNVRHCGHRSALTLLTLFGSRVRFTLLCKISHIPYRRANGETSHSMLTLWLLAYCWFPLCKILNNFYRCHSAEHWHSIINTKTAPKTNLPGCARLEYQRNFTPRKSCTSIRRKHWETESEYSDEVVFVYVNVWIVLPLALFVLISHRFCDIFGFHYYSVPFSLNIHLEPFLETANIN